MVELRPEQELVFFLDVNETLIRTGEVSAEHRALETTELSQFVDACALIAQHTAGLHLILLTGNSFEYTRRIEEPLGVKNLPKVLVTIVSENGLIARSFLQGDLWHYEPSPQYQQAAREMLLKAAQSEILAARYYSQGNEVRTTLKPIANEFTPRELRELEALVAPAVGRDEVVVYAHRYYFDLDPVRIVTEGREVRFEGKYTATQRLIESSADAVVVAVGDSASDLPMFRAVLAYGGHAFWVGNADRALDEVMIQRVKGEFTAGVVEVIRGIRLTR